MVWRTRSVSNTIANNININIHNNNNDDDASLVEGWSQKAGLRIFVLYI